MSVIYIVHYRDGPKIFTTSTTESTNAVLQY